MSTEPLTRNVLLPGCRERSWQPGEDYDRRSSGLWVPPSEIPAPPAAKPIGVGLFSGAGGMDLGFTQAGFHVAAASDGWTEAACTYLVNLGGPHTLVHLIGGLPEGRKREREWHAAHTGETVSARELLEVCGCAMKAGSGWIAGQERDAEDDRDPALPCEHYYLGDVRALTGQRILDDLGLTGDQIGAVCGGPPCQGFSRAGRRDPDDPRNELVFEFMRVVIEIHPQAFVMENVPGLVDMVTRDGIPVIDALALMAQGGGMGTFEALRRSLAETAGVGAAIRTQTVGKKGKMPPGTSGNGYVEFETDQLAMDWSAA